jgi:hypothetical protein
MEASLLWTQAMVLAFRMDIIKEVICKAESTRPPKVSISKMIKAAPRFKASRASRRTKLTREACISPWTGIIQTEPAAPAAREGAPSVWALAGTRAARSPAIRIRLNRELLCFIRHPFIP